MSIRKALKLIKRVQVLELGPDDIVVLKCPQKLSEKHLACLHDFAQHAFNGRRVIVIDSTVSAIQKIRHTAWPATQPTPEMLDDCVLNSKQTA
jgi:hypothetical protein